MTPPALRVDVRAFACPITWVKTRIALDRLTAGDLLEVWLPPGAAAIEVPRTAEEDGHRVVELESIEGGDAFRLVIQKGAPVAAGLP